MQKKIVFVIILCILTISLLTGVAVVLTNNPNMNVRMECVNDYSDITIFTIDNGWAYGKNYSLVSYFSLLDIASRQGVNMQSIEPNLTLASDELDKKSLIVLDGTWLKQNDNQQLYTFLATHVKNVGGIIATGDSTTNLYLTLEKTGIVELSRDEHGNLRLPTGDDSTFVGFALKEAKTPNGELYYGPSHFSTSSTNAYVVLDDIIRWINN